VGVEIAAAAPVGAAGFFTALGDTDAIRDVEVSGRPGAAAAATIDFATGGLGTAGAGLTAGAFAACAILAAVLAKLGGTGAGFAAAAGAGVAGGEIFPADFFREEFLAMSGKITTLAGRDKPAPDFSA
jgi:hypothetical protein